MKYTIKIDPKSVKKNKNGGQDTFIVPGRSYQNNEGALTRSISMVRTLTPIPNYSFRYIQTIVSCKSCQASFPHTDLEEQEIEYDNSYSGAVCPHCGAWECCSFDFETLDQNTGKIIKP